MSKVAVVAVVGALVLTGCGNKTDNKDNKTGSTANADVCKTAKGNGPKVGLAYDVGGRGDQSFNDSAYAGLKKAVGDLKATCVEGEATDGEPESARETRLKDMADAGMNPIIGVGFAYSDAVNAVAPSYPDISFGVIDGFDPDNTPNKNVAYLGFAENEGSYLVGVAAALKSKAGHIGFVGGVHNDLIKKFEAGYVAGAKATKPDIKVDMGTVTSESITNESGSVSFNAVKNISMTLECGEVGTTAKKLHMYFRPNEGTGLDNDSDDATAPRKTFAQAAWQIVVADISMSLDNVLAVAGAARDHPQALIFGLGLSIVLMGVAASFIAGLLNKHRWIAYVGLAIIFYVAGDMIVRGALEIRAEAFTG